MDASTYELLVGTAIAASRVREESGCTIVAVRTDEGLRINPPANMELASDSELILVGSPESERRFLKRFEHQ